MLHYRQALHQMQRGMSDHAIAKFGLIGRHKAAKLRCRAETEGWLLPGAVIPDAATLNAIFLAPHRSVAGPISTLEVHRERTGGWVESGINARVIHRVLCESHGFRGSYSST